MARSAGNVPVAGENFVPEQKLPELYLGDSRGAVLIVVRIRNGRREFTRTRTRTSGREQHQADRTDCANLAKPRSHCHLSSGPGRGRLANLRCLEKGEAVSFKTVRLRLF